MKPEPITLRTYALVLFGLALLALALAICGGAWGPSDLELRVRASEPFNL
jgi:membrane protein required for beta-lactamase induction